MPSVADLIRSPKSIEVPKKPRKIRRRWVWKLPALGQIKVNSKSFGFAGRIIKSDDIVEGSVLFFRV